MANTYEERCLVLLAEARSYICKNGPYFSAIVYGLIPVFRPGIHTLGVTKGLVLAIDPVWYVDMTNELPESSNKQEQALAMRAAVLVHEVMHVLRGISRLEVLPDKELANLAFDIPINDDLADVRDINGTAIWPLPKWVVYSSTFKLPKNLVGEQYYELLEQKRPQLTKQGYLSGGGSGSSSSDPGSGDSSTGNSGADGTPGNSSGNSNKSSSGVRKVGSGRCGGCGGGHFDKEMEDKLDAEFGRTKADVQRIKKEALRDIRDAASSGCGNMPGGLKELLEASNEKSVVPWRTRLSQVIRRATGRIACGQSDFSLKRPSKRSYTRGIMRPGMIDRRVEIAFVEDSSGSMGHEQLKSARIEAAGVFAQLSIREAWFLDADTDAAMPPQRITISQLHSLPVNGRGGTDFRPAIELVQKLKPKPDVVIYLTDGDGPAPDVPPKGIEVVWCIVPTPYGRKPANWGHLVVVSDNQELLEPYGM